jgi:hypothetical protein
MPRKPFRPVSPPRQYDRSYKDLGVLAENGCMIELRTPDPDAIRAEWPRIWLTVEAAEKLLNWLPEAIAEATKPNGRVPA